jgi:hypothetical protein
MCGIVAGILRPRSYVPTSDRPLAASVVLLPVLVALSLGMHAPPEMAFLWRWVLSGLVGCGLLIVWRAPLL